MQGIRPQQLSDEEFLRYAHLTGYDKLSPEWVDDMAARLHRAVTAPPDQTALQDEYQNGYEDGYDEGYHDGCEVTEDDLK